MAAEVPAYLKEQKIPAGLVDENEVEKQLKSYLFKEYGDSLVLNSSNQQIFLNRKLITEKKLDLASIQKKRSSFYFRNGWNC